MIRILIVTPSSVEDRQIDQLLTLATRLPRNDFDVRVCSLGNDVAVRAQLESAAIPTSTIRGQATPPWPHSVGLVRQLAQLRPDVVHLLGMPAKWASFIKCFSAAAIVQTVYELNAEPTLSQVFLERAQQFVPGANFFSAGCIVVESDGLAREIESPKVEVVSPFVCRPTLANSAALRTQLGIRPDAKLIGLFSSMEVDDRAKDALWAMDLLQSVRDDIDLAIYGSGPTSQRLRRYAKQVCVDERVHFLSPTECESAEFFAALDLLWETSVRNRASNGILEAMIRGIPVVASDTPVHVELLAEGRGLLAMSGHRAGFARQSQSLFADPDGRAEIADRARCYVLEKFSVDAFVRSYAEIYESLSSVSQCRKLARAK